MRSLKKRKRPEAVSVSQLLTQFTTKVYPQQLAKWTATPSAENCLYPHGCRCGVYVNGKSRSRVHSSIDRNLAQAMAELDRLSDKVYIPPPIKEKAAVVYRKALDKGLVRGRSIAAIAAAALYAACRGSGTPQNTT